MITWRGHTSQYGDAERVPKSTLSPVQLSCERQNSKAIPTRHLDPLPYPQSCSRWHTNSHAKGLQQASSTVSVNRAN